MPNASFKKTAKDWNEWACQSIKLIRDSIEGEDEARLRSYYILLSYAFELMIKSRLVAISNISEKDLIKNYGHDVVKILKELKARTELERMGIKSLPRKVKEHIYSVETTDNKVLYIHDFTNIRYYPKLKDSWDTEKTILSTVEIMLKIANSIRELWKQPNA